MAMAVNVTVSSTTGSAGLYTYLQTVDLAAPSGATATFVRFLDPVSGFWVELIGTGFTYDGFGNLSGGVITEIAIRNSSNVLQQRSVGFSIAATAFTSAVSSYQAPIPDPAPLDGLLK